MQIRMVKGNDGDVPAWSFSSSQYVQSTVNNVEKYLREVKNKPMPRSMDAPIYNCYCAELDEIAELPPAKAAYYKSLIGVLRWIVELGCVNINCKVPIMLSCMALPCYGHLQQLYNIFAYLKKHHSTEITFDPAEPNIDEELFKREDWSSSVYASEDEMLEEAKPSERPEERGEGFKMRIYIDSDHAGDSSTRR